MRGVLCQILALPLLNLQVLLLDKSFLNYAPFNEGVWRSEGTVPFISNIGSGWSASGFGHVVPGVHLVGDWWAPERVCIWWQKKKECMCRELNLLLGSKIL
jgi:hypothetical protein